MLDTKWLKQNVDRHVTNAVIGSLVLVNRRLIVASHLSGIGCAGVDIFQVCGCGGGDNGTFLKKTFNFLEFSNFLKLFCVENCYRSFNPMSFSYLLSVIGL